MDAGRHEVVPQGVHLEQGRRLRDVAEVVGEHALGERRAGRRLDADEARLGLAGQRLAHERERDAGEARAAADAADHDVGVGVGRADLLDGLLADHRLVQQHVVEHAAQRVFGARVTDDVFDGLGDGQARLPSGSGLLPAPAPVSVAVGLAKTVAPFSSMSTRR